MVNAWKRRRITAEELAAQAGQVVLDVREDDEWRAGHIHAAVHIPMAQLNSRLDELPNDQPIVAVCRSGRRSSSATRALARRGYEVRNLTGGLRAWANAGLPLTTSGGSAGRVI